MIKAEIVAASQCKTKIATFKITKPRYILPEFNTHRAFSRNSASSRAIPSRKTIKSVMENPFIPIAWQEDHSGMQGTKYLDDFLVETAIGDWLGARDAMVKAVRQLQDINVTKQLANRLLEPFMWHTVLVTATEWENFFKLRCPQYTINWEGKEIVYRSKKDFIKSEGKHHANHSNIEWLKINKGQADIHIMAVAEAMWDTYNEAEFKELKSGEWHIPYGDQIDEDELAIAMAHDNLWSKHGNFHTEQEMLIAKLAVSVARCARLSYQTLGDNPRIDYLLDLRLYEILRTNGHWSPLEHVAYAMGDNEWNSCSKTVIDIRDGGFVQEHGWLANFRGWVQQRALFENIA